jgi:hypothetical protein
MYRQIRRKAAKIHRREIHLGPNNTLRILPRVTGYGVLGEICAEIFVEK